MELERKERFRIKVGLEQHTKLHRPAIIFDRRQACYRSNMKRHGYILGDMADNSGERYTIFYDELTERHPKAEANAGTYGFRIVSLIKPKPVAKPLKAIKPKKRNEQLQSRGVR